jgi:hypothetical protein
VVGGTGGVCTNYGMPFTGSNSVLGIEATAVGNKGKKSSRITEGFCAKASIVLTNVLTNEGGTAAKLGVSGRVGYFRV